MEKQEFKILINASKEKVWNVLWSDKTYPAWTSVFCEGSKAETDWKKGSEVLFLNDKNDGMFSTIEESIPNEYMSFKHLGEVKAGVKDLNSGKGSEWLNSLENYTLKPVDGKTELLVDINKVKEFEDYFDKTFPKALEKVKELAEVSAD
jgi:hypothetical protein